MPRPPQPALELQLKGYRLATAEVVYRLPDHPSILQIFVWQHYDVAPEYPVLHRFLDHWTRHIEAELHSVRISRQDLVAPGRYRHVETVLRLH
jgi:uncharacterized protein Usg